MEFNTLVSLRREGLIWLISEVALPKLLLDFVCGAVSVQSRIVPAPTHPTSEIPDVTFTQSLSDSCVCVCQCARLWRCGRALGGLHGPPELLGPSPCLLNLLVPFGGEVIPDQELQLLEFGLEGDSFTELVCRLSSVC